MCSFTGKVNLPPPDETPGPLLKLYSYLYRQLACPAQSMSDKKLFVHTFNIQHYQQTQNKGLQGSASCEYNACAKLQNGLLSVSTLCNPMTQVHENSESELYLCKDFKYGSLGVSHKRDFKSFRLSQNDKQSWHSRMLLIHVRTAF